MQWRTIAHLFGVLLMLYSISFLPSIGVSLWFNDGELDEFLTSLGITLIAGISLWLPNRRRTAAVSRGA